MKCHLNRMTAALLLAVVLAAFPAVAAQAAPPSGLQATQQDAGSVHADGVLALWHRLLDGLAAVFAGDGTTNDPGNTSDGNGSFDPDGYTFVPPIDDGNKSTTTGNGSFDPDG